MVHKNYISVNKNMLETTKHRNIFTGHHIPVIMGGRVDYTPGKFVNTSTVGLFLGGGLDKISTLHFGKKRAEKNNANIQFIV